eukprot:GEMP01039586.1.p1 GENE.GEMP01039586.1~~GEMP01039586.1.p1  ORF type:complete len:283 (+),score=31.78 GEMP01039586.1:38-886(+)
MSISTVDIFLHCAPFQLLLDGYPRGSTKALFLPFYVRVIYGGLGIVSKDPEGAHWLALILGATYTLFASFLFSNLDGLLDLGWAVAIVAIGAASPAALAILQPLAFSMVLLAGLVGVPRAYLTNDAQSMGPILLNLACVVRAILDEADGNRDSVVHVNLVLSTLTFAIRCLVPLADPADRWKHHRRNRHHHKQHKQHVYHHHHSESYSSPGDDEYTGGEGPEFPIIAVLMDKAYSKYAHAEKSDGSIRSSSNGSTRSRGRSSTRRKIICVSDRADIGDSVFF